jgi:hypothetical protein
MPNHHHLNALLAEAHRDDLLRTAAQARLATHVERVRRRRLRDVLLAAHTRVTLAPAPEGLGPVPEGAHRTAQREPAP